MGRPKKNKELHSDKKEVSMSEVDQIESIQSELDLVRVELESAKRELEDKKSEIERLPLRALDKQEQKTEDTLIVKRSQRDALKDKIEKQKAYDDVLVTGKFINRHRPGQPVKLPYVKYETDPVKWWPFLDGKVYTIPRGFADQINGGTEEDPMYYKPHFTEKQGIQGLSDVVGENSAISSIDSSDKKYSFVPVNF
jgi:hypothetical protein